MVVNASRLPIDVMVLTIVSMEEMRVTPVQVLKAVGIQRRRLAAVVWVAIRRLASMMRAWTF